VTGLPGFVQVAFDGGKEMNRRECLQMFTGLAGQGLGASSVARLTAIADGEIK
jgi:hypothetical protein